MTKGAKWDTINLKRRPRRMLIRLRLCDTTLLYASAVAGQQSGIDVTISRADTWAFNRASYADHTEDDMPRRISSERVIATY